MSKHKSAILTGVNFFEQLKEELILPMIADPLMEIYNYKENEMEDLLDSGEVSEKKDIDASVVFPNLKV